MFMPAIRWTFYGRLQLSFALSHLLEPRVHATKTTAGTIAYCRKKNIMHDCLVFSRLKKNSRRLFGITLYER